MPDKNDKLELHMGEDYAVAMLPRDTTDNAAIMFGCNTEDAFCEEVVKRYNAHLDLEAQLARANRIIEESNDMPKINNFPKKISVTIKGDDNNHFLSSDADPSGAAFAEQGQKVKIAVYGLIEVREVSLTVTSTPVE